MLVLWAALGAAALGVVAFAVFWLAQPYRGYLRLRRLPRAPEEWTYVDPESGETRAFPSVFDPPAVTLSVVVPAYNEESRIAVMLDETIEYLTRRAEREKGFSWEILIVSDGSRDGTSRIACDYGRRYGTERVRLCDLVRNHGKGGAVRAGVLRSRGKRILMADADGASRFSDVELLEQALRTDSSDRGVVCGSRSHLEEGVVAKRTFLRNLLMRGFHFLVSLLSHTDIKDTQCGFKLYTREAAQIIFPVLHIERWSFDVELLTLCTDCSIPVRECSINWQEIPGSKLSVVDASLQMFRELLCIRFCYLLRLWTRHDRMGA